MKLISLLVLLSLAAGCAVDETAQVCPIGTKQESDARQQVRAAERAERLAAEPTADPTNDLAVALRSDYEPTRQVLVTRKAVPAGLEVRELIETPTVYLTARVAPDDMVCPTSVGSVAALQQNDGRVVDVRIEAGQFLDTRHFGPVG